MPRTSLMTQWSLIHVTDASGAQGELNSQSLYYLLSGCFTQIVSSY